MRVFEIKSIFLPLYGDDGKADFKKIIKISNLIRKTKAKI